MALSDLELLSLVERAQEAKQGPIGPQGVGIRSIEQPDPFTVVISLTDGRTKEINLTAGPKGDPGEAGKPGRDGTEGRPGSPGKAGAAGVGVAGAPGAPGTSIDTAIVNADGNLLLGLTDGNVLNVGRVVGPAGATGPTGPTGLPGRAGRDGNTILSGPHAPADNEGSEGDFWIDTSSPLFDFYAKGGSGWRKLTSLRAPQTPTGGKMSSGGGMSGNGGSGGGGGELQNTATLPLASPSRYKNHGRALPPSDGLKSQKDLNEWVYSVLLNFDADGSKISVEANPPDPAEVGMLWFSTNEEELTLFIYVDDESGWVPAAPPVSLDGINTTITGIEGDLIELHNNVRQVKGDIVLTNQDLQLLAQDQTRQDEKISEVDGNLDGKLDKTGGQLTGRLVTNSPIWIHPGGQGANGEHNMLVVNQAGADTGSVARFQQNGEDILKIEHAKTINACGNNITNLADPEHERHAVTKQWAEGRYALKSDVPAPPDVVPSLSFASSSNVDPRNKSAPDPGQIVGYFENEPGDGSKSFNYYIGNWNHSVLVNVADLKVAGTLPDDGENDFNHRGVFEMRTSGGDELLHKAIVKSITRSGDILTLLFEGGINLFGQSDTSAQSSARYLFYSL